MASDIIRMTMAVFDSADALSRENEALRELLRRQGLSDGVIQRRVNAYLKASRERESGHQLLKKACEEILKRLPDFDVEEALANMPIRGPKQ